jgi:hypothetical protein
VPALPNAENPDPEDPVNCEPIETTPSPNGATAVGTSCPIEEFAG